MILVCHVILEDHVIKALKSAIAIFFKAHGMSYSHIRNFTIKVALTKTFACVSSNSSLILATSPCITNDEIYAKRLLQVRPKTAARSKKRERERKKQQQSFLLYMQTQKFRLETNNIHHIHIMSKCLGNLFCGFLETTKCQITRFFSGTNHGEDKHGVTFSTTNISLHLTVTCSHLKNVLKAHFQV